MNIIPEREWDRVFSEIIGFRDTVMIIGATDSGKSTFVRYLIKRFIEDHLNVSFIDSDVGQSSLGLPGTISMRVFRKEIDLSDFIFEKMVYVGTTNPSKNIPFIIDITALLTYLGKKNSDITLIDTTGLVSGELGKALKISKIKRINPGHIIALQKSDEIEHILTVIHDISVHRLKVSRMAKTRKREERIHYRQNKIEDYFKKESLSEFIIYIKDTKCFYNGKYFLPREGDFIKGTILGLNSDWETNALGILVELNSDSFVIQSPIQSLKNINRVIFGDLKYQ